MLRFVGNGDQKKFTKNPRHFSMQNPQANPNKKSHKSFLGCGQSSKLLGQGLTEQQQQQQQAAYRQAMNNAVSGGYSPAHALWA